MAANSWPFPPFPPIKMPLQDVWISVCVRLVFVPPSTAQQTCQRCSFPSEQLKYLYFLNIPEMQKTLSKEKFRKIPKDYTQIIFN